MKFFISVLLAVFLFNTPMGKAFADCTAMADDPGVVSAHKLKKEAVAAREKGDYVTAALKFEQAGDAMPMEAYAASYYLNAEGCLVGKYYGKTIKGEKVFGYWIDHSKAVANSKHATELLDKADTKMTKASTDACEYDNGVIKNNQAWHAAASGALTAETE